MWDLKLQYVKNSKKSMVEKNKQPGLEIGQNA